MPSSSSSSSSSSTPSSTSVGAGAASSSIQSGNGGSAGLLQRESRVLFGLLPTRLFNVLWLSISFFVLFSAYNTLQNYVTSLLPGNLGNVSLAVLYCTVAASVFSAPFIVARFGERKTMVFGAACYVVFMISLIEIVYGVVVFCSMIIGFGAGILWVAEGSYLTKNSLDSERGRNSGMFWGIFQLCNVLGNLVAFFVFQAFSSTTLFVMFTVLGSAGVLLMCLLRAIPPEVHALNVATARSKKEARHLLHASDGQRGAYSNHADDDDDDEDDGESTLADQVKNMTARQIASEIIQVFKQPGMLMLMPILFWCGIELSFWAGEFTQLLDSNIIGFVLMFAGIGDALGAIVIGYVSDIIGRSVTMLIGVAVYATALFGTITLYNHPYSDSDVCVSGYCVPWYALTSAFCFGVADAVFNTQVTAIVGSMFAKKSVSAFCVYQFAQNVGSAIGFFYPLLVPMHGDDKSLTQVWLQVSLLSVAATLFILVDRFRLKWRLVNMSTSKPSSAVAPSTHTRNRDGYMPLSTSSSDPAHVGGDTSSSPIAFAPKPTRSSAASLASSTRVSGQHSVTGVNAAIDNESVVMGGSGSAFARPPSRQSAHGSLPTNIPPNPNSNRESAGAIDPKLNGKGEKGDLLETIFSSPPLLAAFSAHCGRVNCQENVDVCVAIDQFRKLPSDGQVRLGEARRIVDTFIVPGGPQQVNIDARMQQRLIQLINSLAQSAAANPDATIDLPANTFDGVDRLIRFYLLNDICPRFVLTGEFRRANSQWRAESSQLLQSL
ncbi:hypothetical protein CAOG_00889 [Capsaspora owczarzaki ATCC 30864]|uniref:UNC93-like protein MFSD11 n=1 Tax=Capsaspora owczarzaki (strain ATCC 30864) TaxID=595528 RepID=A0A0D2WJA7_CAPO3|nr:hypothetical protein CAOG_00889 [Capsaspora owczarzaki ATCC 30864]KJE89418.1 hypothetical protein CAOG_000889 [Capsaspora owczarzaki ATCC 30864]|eukprot:XP_004365760.1 hypothetical protein CAOG_00889 [Capsaspora owczarzaki ATCC 30864]